MSQVPANIEQSPVSSQFMGTISDNELQALTSEQKGFITSIRILQQNQSLSGAHLKQSVAEMFPPASLFSKELCDLAVLHSSLRDFLDSRGANLQQHSSRRIMMTLATAVYDEPEDQQAAKEIVTDIISQGRRNRLASSRHQDTVSLSNLSSSAPESSTPSSSDRVAHNVAMRLKDTNSKFSGELGQSWMEYVDEYTQICRDYSLSPAQKLQYLHNLLHGDAKRFYLDKIDGYATGFQQAVAMVNEEYNSHVRQTRIKDYLNAIRVRSFMNKGVSESDSLSKVYKLIVKLSRQAPQAFRGDANKVEYLRNAVVGFPWAKEPLSRVGTMGLTFQQLHAELAASLQLENDTNQAKSNQDSSSVSYDKTESNQTYFAGQGRYRQGFRPFTRNRITPATTKQSFNPLNIQGCFNCGGKHLMKECPKPIDSAKAAASKIKYYSKKNNGQYAVHSVLAELCAQLDVSDGNTVESEDDDHFIFQTILKQQFHDEQEDCERADDEGADVLDQIVSNTEEMNKISNIHVVSTSYVMKDCSTERFLGACVDSAAQRTVIGKQQAAAYCSEYGNEMDIVPYHGDGPTFCFGTHRHISAGYINIRIPVGDDSFIRVTTAVVDINIPFLFGLENLMKYKMVIDVDQKTLHSKLQGWTIDLQLKNGHLYYQWDISILFTESELRKVHNHFYHPEPERLFSLFKRAEPSSASPQLLQDLNNVNSTCDTCQREGNVPHRFRVSLPSGEIVFNRENCLDLMKINGHQILHIVDRDTRFSAAVILEAESTKAVWRSYMETWVNKYVGFPDLIAVDQGPQFQSNEWKSLCQLAGIEFKPSGVESHNAINVGERYHAYLRRIFNKIENSHKEMPPQQILSTAVRAMNDTAGPNGLVPTLLVFGILPRIQIVPSKLPDQIQRLHAMKQARNEMAKVISSSKLTRALRMNVPSASRNELKIGDKVLVYREKPIEKWVGPHQILNIDGKMAHIDYNGEMKLYSVDKLKLYDVNKMNLPPPQSDDGTDSNYGKQPVPSDITKEISDLLHEHSSPTSPPNPLVDKFMESLRDDGVSFMTRILSPDDKLGESSQFQEAKRKEIQGLISRQSWNVVERADLHPKSNILGGRFVLTLKNTDTPNEKPKARYVAQGHRDKEKFHLVHDITTLRQSSIRLIMSLATIKQFDIFSHDVTQAYLQSEDALSREVYILPHKRDLKYFSIGEHQALKLLKPLYGTCDAGDYWYETISRHAKNDLGMIATKGDPSLYYELDANGILRGLMGLYVDDGMLAGNRFFQSLTTKTMKTFESNPRIYSPFTFFGCECSQSEDYTGYLSQSKYLAHIKPLPSDDVFKTLRSSRASLAWLTHTRPDINFEVNQLAQATEEHWNHNKSDIIKSHNKLVQYLLTNSNFGLKFVSLRNKGLHLRVYCDASFAGNRDLTSQLGFIILLADEDNNCHILDFSSRKSDRVVRSIMSGEMYAFLRGFDRCFILRHDLELILQQQLNIYIFTDSKQVFDCITKSSPTTERRLMIDIHAAKDSYDSFEIANVALIRSDQNLADCLTKASSKDRLQTVMTTGIDDVLVSEWIDRKGLISV